MEWDACFTGRPGVWPIGPSPHYPVLRGRSSYSAPHTLSRYSTEDRALFFTLTFARGSGLALVRFGLRLSLALGLSLQ